MKAKLYLDQESKLTNRILAAEVSAISKYFDRLVQWCPLAKDDQSLLNDLENPLKMVANSFEELDCETKSLGNNKTKYNQIVLLNQSLHYQEDIQKFLSQLKDSIKRNDRVVVVIRNPYFRWLYMLTKLIGFEWANETTFLTLDDVNKLAKLSGFELERIRRAVYVPFNLFGLEDFLNTWLPCIPILQQLGFFFILVLRPIVQEFSKPSLSVIIPVRNEKGNLENIFKTLPLFSGVNVEIIFVEGNSTDGSKEEIERLIPLHCARYPILSLQQKGKGKSDAVQLGFANAKNDLLVILDSDLSTPAEFLENFYDAYCAGLGDFINGSRRIYPIEKGSMQFLNKLGNNFFVQALNLVLGIKISDSLCGSKMFSKNDYQRFCQWRKEFGELDPFGDYDLLFPAAIMGLGIVDVPVRYKERVYGTTSIRRFSDGWTLLKMVLTGFMRITLGHTEPADKRLEKMGRERFAKDDLER